ncbi:MAG: hypothetical protein U0V48_14040 [Anaerolineales bacterium]
MNPPKVDEYDYIQFLLAAQRVFSTVEASKLFLVKKAHLRMTPTPVCFNAFHQIAKPSGESVEQLTLKTQGVLG